MFNKLICHVYIHIFVDAICYVPIIISRIATVVLYQAAIYTANIIWSNATGIKSNWNSL